MLSYESCILNVCKNLPHFLFGDILKFSQLFVQQKFKTIVLKVDHFFKSVDMRTWLLYKSLNGREWLVWPRTGPSIANTCRHCRMSGKSHRKELILFSTESSQEIPRTCLWWVNGWSMSISSWFIFKLDIKYFISNRIAFDSVISSFSFIWKKAFCPNG